MSTNYTFGADMTATANSDGSLTITSKITATSATRRSKPSTKRLLGKLRQPLDNFCGRFRYFNFAIYGQTRTPSAVKIDETESPYSDF